MRARKGHARRRARKRLFREVKGNYAARGKLVKMATETLFRARAFAFRDRRYKKREFRALWIVRTASLSSMRPYRSPLIGQLPRVIGVTLTEVLPNWRDCISIRCLILST